MTREELQNLTARPKGMSHSNYARLCKAEGCEPMSKQAYKALPEGDEDDEDDDAEKGGIEVPDLVKSLQDYEAVEAAILPPSRRDQLRDKLVKGTITPEEEREYGGLLSGSSVPTGDLFSKSLVEETEEADTHGLVDANPLLKSLLEGIDSRIETMTEAVHGNGRQAQQLIKAQGQLIKALVGAQVQQQEINKALTARLGLVERTPNAPRAVSTRPEAVRNRDINKGGAGGAGEAGGQTLTKSQIRSGLQLLTKSAADKGDDAAVEQLGHAMALVENGHALPPQVLASLRQLN